MLRWLSFLLLLAAAVPAQSAAQGFDVDLELVLAVDGSASVDYGEYRLQVEGIAAAFRDPAVIKAIQSGGIGRIAVAVMVWSHGGSAKDVIGWRVIADDASARRFADVIEGRPRLTVPSSTGIAAAIRRAAELLDRNDIKGARRVIDVSGDGRDTLDMGGAPYLIRERDAAVTKGIVINGLAILTDDPVLLEYYRRRVIGGSEAFALAADDFHDFARAIKRKLLREIRGLQSLSQR